MDELFKLLDEYFKEQGIDSEAIRFKWEPVDEDDDNCIHFDGEDQQNNEDFFRFD